MQFFSPLLIAYYPILDTSYLEIALITALVNVLRNFNSYLLFVF